ncbi:MAG: LLM class flavin-dependent oxidoreductase [Thermoplasmata archaeon]
MQLSAFSIVDAYAGDPPSRARYAEVRALAEASEAAGLRALWVAEHHFHTGGVCPSPPVLLGWLGAHTQSLRLGVMVSVLPFHSPIELAEQYALLDQLLGGRLLLGVGSGYIPMEFEGFGLDPVDKRARFDAHLSTILAAFRGEEVRADSRRALPVRLNVRPLQAPHPPLVVAVQRREAIPFLARAGRSIAVVPYATLSGLAELTQVIREYRQNLPDGVPGSVAAAVHLYAGSQPEVARACLARYLEGRRQTQSTNYLARVAEDPHRADPSSLEEAGFALFGTAPEVRDRLQAYALAGVDEILGIFDFGGLPIEEVTASVGALGSEFAALPGE